MARHVERHLWHLFLAALTANLGSDGENDDSDHDSDTLPRQAEKSGTMPHGPSAQRQAGEIDTLKDHPLYTQAVQGQDGLWHCPWEGEGYCDHKPSVLRADFECVANGPAITSDLFDADIDNIANSSDNIWNHSDARSRDVHPQAKSLQPRRSYTSMSKKNMACTRTVANFSVRAPGADGRGRAMASPTDGYRSSTLKTCMRTFPICQLPQTTI